MMIRPDNYRGTGIHTILLDRQDGAGTYSSTSLSPALPSMCVGKRRRTRRATPPPLGRSAGSLLLCLPVWPSIMLPCLCLEASSPLPQRKLTLLHARLQSPREKDRDRARN